MKSADPPGNLDRRADGRAPRQVMPPQPKSKGIQRAVESLAPSASADECGVLVEEVAHDWVLRRTHLVEPAHRTSAGRLA